MWKFHLRYLAGFWQCLWKILIVWSFINKVWSFINKVLADLWSTKLFCFNYLSTVILSQLHVLKLHCFKDFIFPLLHQHSFFSLPDAVLLRVWQFVYVVYVCMLEFRQVPVIDFVLTWKIFGWKKWYRNTNTNILQIQNMWNCFQVTAINS